MPEKASSGRIDPPPVMTLMAMSSGSVTVCPSRSSLIFSSISQSVPTKRYTTCVSPLVTYCREYQLKGEGLLPGFCRFNHGRTSHGVLTTHRVSPKQLGPVAIVKQLVNDSFQQITIFFQLP